MTALTINGKPFPGSMWGFVLHKVCRGDRYAAGRILYRARGSENPIAWIKRGLVPDEKGERYALTPCQDETDDPQAVQDWVDEHVLKITPKSEVASLGSILRGIADE